MADLNSEVQQQVATLRKSFLANTPRPIEYRRAQLRAFQRMMTVEKDRFCDALTKDLGKHPTEGFVTEVNPVLIEIQHMLDHIHEWSKPEYQTMDPFKYAVVALTGHGRAALYRDPYGVVLIIGAWNYPVHLTLLPVVGAIATGNCCLVKVPSPKYSTATSALIAELVPKYLDSDCVQVVEGGRDATQAVLQKECRYDLVFYTGGSYVGKMVAAAAAVHLTPCVLELGGQNPVIVDKSADLSVAAKRLMWGKFTNAGQTCVTANHVFVHESVGATFTQACIDAIKEFYGATTQARKSSKSLGRIINARAHQGLTSILDEATKFVVFGGDHDESSLYIEPTILNFESNMSAFDAAAVMRDEIFGPILPIVYFKHVDDVITKIQTDEKPLSLYVFTNDYTVSEKILRETTSGHAVVNDILLQFCAPIPFGGVGNSGMGGYHGKFSWDTFTHCKGVLKRHPYGEIPARFPPYGVAWKTFLVNILSAPYTANQINGAKVVTLALVFGVLRSMGVTTLLAVLTKAWLLQLANLL